jgi:hypothetical protein
VSNPPSKPAFIKSARNKPLLPPQQAAGSDGETPQASEDWLRIEDQVQAADPDKSIASESKRATDPDPLVSRLLQKERARAAEWAKKAPEAALPTVAEPAERARTHTEIAVSPGGSSPGADPETALLHALPAAIALARWGNPGVKSQQVLKLRLRLNRDEFHSLEGIPSDVPELDSVLRNLTELLRHDHFIPSREPLRFEIRFSLSRTLDHSLPALGFTPARFGQEASAYVIFPNGLRVAMQLRAPVESNP